MAAQGLPKLEAPIGKERKWPGWGAATKSQPVPVTWVCPTDMLCDLRHVTVPP